MFAYCYKLTSLDLSNWDTSQVTNTTNFLEGCSALTTITMKNCSQATVDKIKAAVEAAGRLGKVNFIVDDGILLN